MLEKYIEEYEGNIRDEDDTAEMLYKMNEHLKHVNSDLTRYVGMEHSMADFIKQHSALPEVINSFMGIPGSLEKHMTFVDTLDEQLQMIIEQYPAVVEFAMDMIGDNEGSG